MRYLLLERDHISGTIPTELGTLPLTSLDLSENELSGAIPTEILKYDQIRPGYFGLFQLDLDTNQLTGTVLTEIVPGGLCDLCKNVTDVSTPPFLTKLTAD
eukprot:2780173-Ditylum_brightwellii.AAC.1